MRILTCLHTLDIGGSQINAIELAATVAKQGHEVVICGPDGPLRTMLDELGLEFIQTPPKGDYLSPRNAANLVRIVRRRAIDVVHAYEWSPALDAAYGPHLVLGVPVVITVMSMTVSDFLPRHLPLVLGTAQLAESERRRRAAVYLIEPPVDTTANAPVRERAAARARFGLCDDEVAVVVVCRLVASLKLAGLLEAVAAVGSLRSRQQPFRLLIVGDGPCREQVQQAAEAANLGAGAQCVVLTGQMLDPRDAYAAADIVLGMGGSALRGMAFAKPLIVQGERGFWELLTPSTLSMFLDQGWYGVGDGSSGVPRLVDTLLKLGSDPALRAELGAFSREVVSGRFSLEAAGQRQAEIYASAAAHRWRLPTRSAALLGPAARYVKFRVARARNDVFRRQPWVRQVLGGGLGATRFGGDRV